MMYKLHEVIVLSHFQSNANLTNMKCIWLRNVRKVTLKHTGIKCHSNYMFMTRTCSFIPDARLCTSRPCQVDRRNQSKKYMLVRANLHLCLHFYEVKTKIKIDDRF